MARTGNIINARDSRLLSHLPATVIDNILKCLPLEDAARTSIFSKIWSHRWRRLPQLVFDDKFCKQAIMRDQSALLTTIYQVLLLHRGPLLKFTLALPELERSHHIDQFIFFLSTKGIQDFTLHTQYCERYKLPLSLYSCMELTHLDLCFCVLEPPLEEFPGFLKLVSLELRDVAIRDDILARLISCCPLLENLRLSFFARFSFLEVFAPNLRYLLCEGYFHNIFLQYTPCLATCRMYLTKEVFTKGGTTSYPVLTEEASRAVKFFGSIPLVEFLELGNFYVKYLAEDGVPKRFPTTLCHLRTIKLHRICLGEFGEVLLVLCLLRSSPNLEKIEIQAFIPDTCFGYSKQSLDEEMECSGDICLKKLRVVEILNLSNWWFEFEFTRLLLTVSPNLEKMVVGSNPDEVFNDELVLLKELTRFRRASPLAEVIYKQPDELPPF